MKPFGSASELLISVNNYLDSLEGVPPRSVEDARARMKRILWYREEMDAFHFRNPRFAVTKLMAILHDSMREMSREDLAEISPELSFLRYTYEQRRIAYDRARAAYIANRAAARILQWGLFSEMLDYLPYGGEYIAALERYGSTALLVYRHVLEDLGVRDPQLVIDQEGDLDEVRPKKGVLGDRVSTEVLVSVLLRMAVSRTISDVLAEERREIKNYDRMLEYERIVHRYRPDTLRENPHLLWDLLQALEERGFLKNGDVDPDIIDALRKRRSIRFRRFYDAVRSEMSRFFLEYYLLVPARVRRNVPLFPGLPPTPEPLARWMSEEDLAIVREKIVLESSLRMPSRYLGAALLCASGRMSVADASSRYGLDRDKLLRAVDAVSSAKDNDRVRRFLEKVGKRGRESR